MTTNDTFNVFYKGKPYGIADFINLHPGGVDILLPYKDKDITEAFDVVGHSAGAMKMLNKRLLKDQVSQSNDSQTNNSSDSNEKISDIANKTKEYLIRAIYIEMLGHEAQFAHFHSVNLTQDKLLPNKRAGYLACNLLLSNTSE